MNTVSGRCIPVVLLSLLTACTPPAPETGAWIGERIVDERGLTVRTLSGQIWESDAWLSEEISIGTEEEGPYLLEDVTDITADDEHIYILDSDAPVLRVFDHTGRHRRDIGRRGEGPGEFRDPTQVAIDPIDGRIFVRDRSLLRFNIYSPAGDPIAHWRIPFRFRGESAMTTVVTGGLYTEIRDSQNHHAMARLDGEGAYSDTLWVPVFERPSSYFTIGNHMYPIPFSPAIVWCLGPSKTIVAGLSDEYRFEVWRANRREFSIERVDCRVPVADEEYAWHRQNLFQWIQSSDPDWNRRGVDIPRMKPAFYQFVDDDAGRFWVFRDGPGRMTDDGSWRDSLLIDVFDHDGRYLGAVAAPAGFTTGPAPCIRGDTVIAAFWDEDEVPFVKTYRIRYHRDE